MSNINILNALPVIGFDGGNKLAKTPNSYFHAGLRSLGGKPAAGIADEMDLLRINGQLFSICDDRPNYERDKSINSNYLYLTLIGIAKELRARGMGPTQEIVLAAGLPPGHMATEKLSNSLRNYYMQNDGLYRFQCGEISHQIALREVIICPQAYSIFLTLPKELISRPNIHIVDIGGGTVDDVELVHQRPALDMLSLDKGVIYLYNKISSGISGMDGRQITESQIDDIINGGQTCQYFSQEHIDFIHDTADKHVADIFGRFREMGADWKSGFVVFCGGGSILLKNYINKYAQKLTGSFIIIEDICANAKGFEVFARVTLRNRK